MQGDSTPYKDRRQVLGEINRTLDNGGTYAERMQAPFQGQTPIGFDDVPYQKGFMSRPDRAAQSKAEKARWNQAATPLNLKPSPPAGQPQPGFLVWGDVYI